MNIAEKNFVKPEGDDPLFSFFGKLLLNFSYMTFCFISFSRYSFFRSASNDNAFFYLEVKFWFSRLGTATCDVSFFCLVVPIFGATFLPLFTLFFRWNLLVFCRLVMLPIEVPDFILL